jgi:anti-sigma B factor antagonist
MADEEQGPDRLLVLVEGRIARVRVEGRGSFRVSPALKDFAVAALENGAHRLVMDFQACVGMDSTFMGVMAGLAFRFRQSGGEGVTALNLSTKTRHLLATLGLDRLMETHKIGETPPDLSAPPADETLIAPPPAADLDRTLLTETMIEAHEDLIKAAPANFSKFKDVLQYLREDLHRSTRAEKE